jgi:hypothetical protein
MATEKLEPRTGLIMRLGALAVFTLIVVHAALVSYYDSIATAEEQRKIGAVKPEALLNLRADEKGRLTTGALPIDKAMQELAAKGRMGADPAIVPTASKDVAPLNGWKEMPLDLPPGAMVPPPPLPAAPSLDAGAAAMDGGAATHAGKPDGGPSRAPDGGRARHP